MSALTDWIAENPRSPALALAQVVLPVFDDVRVFAAARLALRMTAREVGRMTQTEENDAFDKVQSRIADLQDALTLSPLPRNRAHMLQISGPNLPDAELAFGWREPPDNMIDGAYPLSLEGVLKLAETLLQEHRDALPVHAVRRHRERPEIAAFVHWFDYFVRRFDVVLVADEIGKVAHAVLDLTDGVSAEDVRAILKTAHPKLSSAKRRR